jgi:Cu-Zn family superoxide dismutase
MKAEAELKDPGGKIVGMVWFEQAGPMVKVRIKSDSLPPGEHSMHLHEKAACDGPDFESAGAHFNPTGRKHGFLNPGGPHAGDLPNIVVDKNGKAEKEMMTGLVTLDKGAVNSLLKPGGTSVVIHQNPDDYISDPAGGGGTRIACGVITETK